MVRSAGVMRSRVWSTRGALLALWAIATHAAPPDITFTSTPTLRSDASSYDVTSSTLGVNDVDGDNVTCQVTSSGLPFNVMLLEISTGYLMVYTCTDPSTLTASSYSVNVQCTDGTNPVDRQVTVSVIGNRPPQPAAGSNLQEAVTLDVASVHVTSSVLHTVLVTDPDNDTLTCVGQTTASFLAVDPNDCTIRTTVDLWSQTLTAAAVVDVLVSDGAGHSVTFRRTLSFINPNTAPAFEALATSVDVQENADSSYVIFTFSATDNQPFSRTFTTSSGASLFAFSSSAGTVKLAPGKRFDFESAPLSYVITCVADDTFFQSTATVTVNVQDVNEPPALSPAVVSVTVTEGGAGTMSAAVAMTCSDTDAGDSVGFSVLAGSANSDFFYFPSPSTSTMSNLRALDREGAPASPVTVTVACTDRAGLTATGQVVVTITDVNDNDPVFVPASLVMRTIHLGMVSGTVLGTVRATDTDLGPNADLSYTLGSASSLFSVSPDGQVTLVGSVSLTYGSTVTFDVKATDKGSPARSTTRTVTVLWNEPPVFTNLPATAQLPEDPDVSKLVFTLATSDPENDVVTCDVTAVSPADKTGSKAFAVRPVSGTSNLGVFYTASEPLDRSAAASFLLTITVSDGKGGQTSSTLTVEVTANTPPAVSCAGSAPFSRQVDVSTASIDDLVASVTVTDVENDHISYIVTFSPNTGAFKSDGAGSILVGRDLKLETIAVHTLDIAVSDNVNDPVTCVLHVSLTNLNQPPQFQTQDDSVQWADTTPSGTTLFQFSVTDTEPTTLVWDVIPAAGAAFLQLDNANGAVKLASGQSFDYETKPRQFVVTCTASDGYFRSTSTVTISVLDTNDPPYVQASTVHVSVSEGKANEVSFVPDYKAQDPDGDPLTYRLVTGTYSPYFTIDTSTGRLTNLVALDRDADTAVNPLTLQVTVTDPTGASASVDVKVILTDINDNPPKFDLASYEFKVGLSSQKGQQLGTLVVADKDEVDTANAAWDLVVTSQLPAGYVTVEADGRVFLSHGLDLEYGTLISLKVEARDRGTPSLTSAVVVDVVWNQGPQLHNLPAATYVHEDWTAERELYLLSVSDLETDQYACVLDKVTPNTLAFDVVEKSDKVFSVFYTGSVKLSVKDTSYYDLFVRCYDENGEVTKKLMIVVRSNVAPVLPCSPQASLTVDAMTIEQGDAVYTVGATDAESDPLAYSVTSSDFYVGTYSGIIRARNSLKSATTDQFAVPVAVSDPTHTSYCTVIIYLTNVNERPVFSNLDTTVEVAENTAAGSLLYDVSVLDPNIFTTNIGLTWTSFYKSKFDVTVSGTSVKVRLGSSTVLDYESGPRTFTLSFVTTDGYLTSEEKSLTIQVANVNEPPVFLKNIFNYYVTFLEVADPPEVQSLGCSVVDPDLNDRVTLTLTGTYADFFTIADLDNCQLTLVTEYDLDNGLLSPTTLTLTATDQAGLSTQATVTVTIVEINDNTPLFNGPQSLSIEVPMLAGDVIGAVEARDIDSGSNGAIHYSILTAPLNSIEADKYINFLSTGKFVLRQSMVPYVSSSENFQYIIEATDFGNPPRSSTTTCNIIFDPINDTTTAPPTTTAITTATTTDKTELIEEPLVIGMLVGVVCAAALLAVLGALLAWKFWHNGGTHSSSSHSPKDLDSRSPTPVRSNKISVVSMDNIPLSGYNVTAAEGRKITTLTRPWPYL